MWKKTDKPNLQAAGTQNENLRCPRCGIEYPTNAHRCSTCGADLPGFPPGSDISKEALESVSAESPSATESHSTNFIVKHWRGGYSLGFSYWVIGFLLSLTALLITTAMGMSNIWERFGPKVAGAAILGIYCFVIPLTIWQLVGIWRSAQNHTARGGKAFWAGLAKLMVVLGLLRFAVDFKVQVMPIMTESFNLLAGIDNTPAYQIRLLRNGTELELSGGIPFGTADAVKKALDAAPKVKIIHLNSQGGRIGEAIALYRTIKDRELITYTSTNCVSACSLAFLAGRKRYLSENGRLGFHSASFGTLSGEKVNGINSEFRRILQKHGLPKTFIDHAISTSSNDMWYPSKNELLKANVIDKVVDSRYFGLSGIDQWDNEQEIESGLLSNPVMSAIARHDKKHYEKLRNIMISGIRGGRSQIEIQKDLRSIIVDQLIPKYLTIAPSTELVRYWKSQIAEMKYLATLDPQYCVDFSYPELVAEPLDLQKLLPDELMQKDLTALAALIEGATTYPQGHNSSPTIEADINETVQKVIQKYPHAAEVLTHPKLHKDEPDLLCDVIVSLYSEVLALPDVNRSGAVLRNISSEQ